ncbi:MAG: hypothetical protein IAE85_00955 [Anaerolinea sp.]|nr:hypothetical protein [Anaerolinea sp.]HRI56637.1 DUF6516 family protein [Anaerolineae bacterium]
MLRRSEYEALVYSLTARFPEIRLSTLVVAPTAYSMAHVTGMIAFGEDIVLCIHELVDFRQGCILSYRYEVTRSIPPFVEKALPSADEYCAVHYAGKEKLYWYDSQPHPDSRTLQSTHPHHKHIPPDIKHNRIPAPGLSFTTPNLPFLIEEIQSLLQSDQ